MRREAMRAHSRGVRGDSALFLLQYACLKLSKPGLASRPWQRLPLSPCQCQLQLGVAPAADARLSLARGNACSPLKVGFFSPSYNASFLPLHGCLSSSSLTSLFLCFFLAWFNTTVLVASSCRYPLFTHFLFGCLLICMRWCFTKSFNY